MKELEKAKELVEKFKPLVRTPRFGKRHTDPYYLAKEAAIICCDEILEASPINPNPNGYYEKSFQMDAAREYWQQVKTEIKKL